MYFLQLLRSASVPARELWNSGERNAHVFAKQCKVSLNLYLCVCVSLCDYIPFIKLALAKKKPQCISLFLCQVSGRALASCTLFGFVPPQSVKR